MAVNIQGNNYGIAVDGDLNIEKLEFEFGKGVKSVSGVHRDAEDAEIVEEIDNSSEAVSDVHIPLTKNDRVTIALTTIINNRAIKYKYDYAMIKMILEQEYSMTFDSTPSFIEYLKNRGISFKLPSEDSINNIIADARGEYPEWNWNGLDATETERRNNIARQFISAYNRAK